jgi:hypothetical protein
MKVLFAGIKEGVSLVYKMLDSKVPMWVCGILCLITIPISLIIVTISYLVRGNAIPEYVIDVQEGFKD